MASTEAGRNISQSNAKTSAFWTQSQSRVASANDVGRDYFEIWLYPTVTEANRSQTVAGWFRGFEFLFICLQVFLGCWFQFTWSLSSSGLRVVQQILFFGFVGDIADYLAPFIALIIVDVVTAAFLVAVLVRYHVAHDHNRWMLFILRYWHAHLFNVLAIPNMMMSVLTFAYLGTQGGVIGTVIPLLSLVTTIYSLFHYLVLSPVFMKSPYLTPSPIHAWNPGDVLLPVLGFGLLFGAAGLFESFHWIFAFLPRLGGAAVAISYFLMIGIYFPYRGIGANVVSGAIGMSCIPSCLISAVRTKVDLPDVLVIVVPIVAFVALLTGFSILFTRRREFVKQRLSYASIVEGAVKPPDSQRQEYCDEELNLKRRQEALMYIRIGFEEICDLFIDWSLLRHVNALMEDDPEIIVFSAWLVSLFPSEIQFLHNFLSQQERMHGLSIPNRSMFFQIHRIHIFRQSSASREATLDFERVKKLTSQAIASYCKVWTDVADPNADLPRSTFFTLASIRRRADAAWAEALDKYPNNPRFLKEYARYLLDCRCSFREALIWNHRASQVEQGHKMENDRTFHKFVLTFPAYLKTGIVNHRGKLVGRQADIMAAGASKSESQSGKSSSSSFKSDDASSSEGELDLVENQKFLAQANLRLALQRAVQNLQSTVVQRIRLYGAIKLVLSVAFVIIVYVILAPVFNERLVVFEILEFMGSSYQDVLMAGAQVPWIMWNYSSQDRTAWRAIIGGEFANIETYPNISATFDHQVVNLSVRALTTIGEMNTKLYLQDFANSEYLSNFAEVYMTATFPSTLCCPNPMGINLSLWKESNYTNDNLAYLGPLTNMSQDILLDQLITLHANMLAKLGVDWITEKQMWHYFSVDFCTAFTQQKYVSQAMAEAAIALSETRVGSLTGGTEMEAELVEESSFDVMINFLIAFSPACMFIFVLPSVIFLYTGLDQLDQYEAVMQSLSRPDCLKTAERIAATTVTKKDKENAIPSGSEMSDSHNSWIFVFLTAVIISVLLVLILVDARMTADDLNALQEHYISHILLRGYMFEATRMLDYYIMFAKLQVLAEEWLADRTKPQVAPMHFYELDLLLEDASASTQGAIAMLKELSLGDERWGPAIGISSQSDAVRFSDQCKIDIEPGHASGYFRCLSLERIFGYWAELQTSLQYDSKEVVPTSPDMESLAVLMMSRVPLGFDKLLGGFSQAFRDKIDNFKFLLQIVLIASIVCLVLFYVTEIFVVASVSEAVITFRSLLLRVNPVTFVATQPMIALVYGSREVDSRVTSAAHAVFQTSQDALISLNQEGIIESLNPSATTIFGYTPEQMLGQSLKMVVNPEFEGNGGLFTTMNLMKTGQSGLVYEANVSGTKDDGTQVPLHLTLLGFSSNGRLAESFAVMCKDQTEEVSQKNAVEEAKKQSENLLMQILPRDIIMRLNRGDKNISFTVASATIVFMDIEKFSNYSANLSAAQLMQNLGLVFTSYDRLLPKFPLITKIKLIGDDYMAAAGLFNPDEEPAAHANQVVQFALECLAGLEDLHQQLNASLQVRIGVNTNGPLIAGVLGTDKPLFDIIGDPINVAARLQSTDIPGLVQVSEATYKLIADGSYHIVPRGEVELKGKGKQMTYLVHPKERS